MGLKTYYQKEMFGLQNNSSEMLIEEITEKLDMYFNDKISSYTILEYTDTPYKMFRIRFSIYNYFNIMLNYDRGRFGCSIIQGEVGISLENSQKWYDKADMNIFLEELEQQIELRIPNKFLEYYGWKK